MAVGLGNSMGPTYQMEAPMSLRVPVQNPTDITYPKKGTNRSWHNIDSKLCHFTKVWKQKYASNSSLLDHHTVDASEIRESLTS